MITVLVDSESRSQALEIPLIEDIASRAAIALDNARLYHEIRDGDRRKDEFLAMLGHELRNPLAAMANALECLEMMRDDPGAVEASRDVFSRQLRQMTRLVDDLLDVSRITRGKVSLRKEFVDLEAIVKRAITTIMPALEARRHQLRVDLPPENITLHADAARLEQILTNLLHNAVKYTEPGGSIQVSAARDDDTLSIRVKDNGLGIPPELLAKIFDLFVQGDRSLDRSQGGLGIGLTLVRRLVEMHDGHVAVSSAGANEGAEFTVVLPAPAARTANGENHSSVADPVVARSRRILVVDDNADLANTTARICAPWATKCGSPTRGCKRSSLPRDTSPTRC